MSPDIPPSPPLLVGGDQLHNHWTAVVLLVVRILHRKCFQCAICHNKNKECQIDSAPENGSIITGLFNNQAFHSVGISLAAIDLAVVRYSTQNPNYSIEVSNHPLPRTTADKLLQVQYATPELFQFAQNLMYSMSFVAASFAVLLVKEKSNKGKHLQQVCGVKLYLFWITSFIWDYLMYIISCLLVMVMFYVFDEEPLKSMEQESRLFVMFATHGLALVSFSYLLSFMFDDSSTAYNAINNTSISWSKIFGAIERAKETLNIEDYSVGQTSLEQIFLTFAAQQNVD